MKRTILCFLTFALFALPVMGQTDVAYVLIKMTNAADPNAQDQMQAGFPVSVHDFNPYGGKIVLPMWGVLEVRGATSQQIIDSYLGGWNREIDFDWTYDPPDPQTDTYHIRAYVLPSLVSATGLNGLTRDKVESFLNKWNATVDSVGPNSVVFTANIFNAIKSEGFWGRDFSMFDWSDVYDSVTQIHRVTVDYSNFTVNQNEVASIIINHGCQIVGSITKNGATFDCARSTVQDQFKQDVKQAAFDEFSVRKFRFLQSDLDLIIGAGGTYSVNKQQVIDRIRNRLDD